MKILGIDYGKSKVGLAIADSKFPFPFGVIRFRSEDFLLRKIVDVVEEEKIEKVVLGVSEGRMKKETVVFGQKLKRMLKVPIVFQDETLTSKEAQLLSLEAGIKRKKRRSLEDAYAASLILENYLERSNS
jgi:putative Holliday junction resolvase